MIKLHYKYDSISAFYKEALKPTKYGDASDLKEHLESDESDFRGMSINDIEKYKYGYIPGIANIKKLDLSLNVGGSKRNYKYDEFDGDDLNYDRLLDGFPPMRKRVKTHGVGSGRIVNVHVVISENCCTSADEMLKKAYTAMSLADMLESSGYRVAIYACDCTKDCEGTFKNEKDVEYQVSVCLKKPEETLNKGLVLNGISPWFFRYYIFAHQKGHYINSWGMGRAIAMKLEQTKENIVINRGECLSDDSCKKKIEEIKKLFGV